MSVRPTKWEGVYSEGPWLLTRNLVPGATVYGEGLVQSGHDEFRRWDANRSKLAAYLKCGGNTPGFWAQASRIYLVGGKGGHPTHVSQIYSPWANTVPTQKASTRS